MLVDVVGDLCDFVFVVIVCFDDGVVVGVGECDEIVFGIDDDLLYLVC